jgi:hypothetical protein
MTDECHQPVAPAHDRRHDGAQFRGEDPTTTSAVKNLALSRPIARHGELPKSCAFSVASHREPASARRPSTARLRRCGSSSPSRSIGAPRSSST